MMENQLVTHVSLNSKYKIQFEQSATKGVLGFKVEASGDNLNICQCEARELLDYAQRQAKLAEIVPVPPAPIKPEAVTK